MMTSNYLNSSAPKFPIDLNEDHQHYQLFTPNSQSLSSSSSSPLSYHMFCNSTQDQTAGCYHGEEIQHHQNQPEVSILASRDGGSHDQENKGKNGLKLYLWKDKDMYENQSGNNIPVKWMSSKMRLMKKMKKSDQAILGIKTNTTMKLEDQKQQSSSLETDNSSNSSSNNINNPIRVCSDCNTTKTPLWRSGPKGPKSLCNACGIRQRKARRAMAIAAAAAAANDTIPGTESSSLMKPNKVQHKDKIKNNGHLAPYKKRFKFSAVGVGPSDHEKKKLCFEEFLLNLSTNLATQRVFPQDEKEAAILLMALSCGLVHG